MKIKGGEEGSLVGWEKRGWKLQTNFKNSKVRLFEKENLGPFIASIYM